MGKSRARGGSHFSKATWSEWPSWNQNSYLLISSSHYPSWEVLVPVYLPLACALLMSPRSADSDLSVSTPSARTLRMLNMDHDRGTVLAALNDHPFVLPATPSHAKDAALTVNLPETPQQ